MVTMYRILTDIEEGQRKVRNMAQTVGRHLRRLGFGLVQRLYMYVRWELLLAVKGI